MVAPITGAALSAAVMVRYALLFTPVQSTRICPRIGTDKPRTPTAANNTRRMIRLASGHPFSLPGPVFDTHTIPFARIEAALFRGLHRRYGNPALMPAHD